MTTQNHAGREQGKENQRKKENNVSGIQYPFLESLEVSDEAKWRNRIDNPGFGPTLQEFYDRPKTGQD